MGKYLHRFKDYDTFDENYNGDGPVTAITVDVASAYTACDDLDSRTVTHDFDGTYVFDREIENFSSTTCDGHSGSGKARVFKLGNREVYDICFLNECGWSSELEVMARVYYFQDITNAFAPGDADLHVSSISRGEKPYHEPWVSYTTYDTQLVSGTLCNEGVAMGPCTGEFKGVKVTWEPDQT